MAIPDFEALDRAPLQKDPCDFVVVPHFVRSAALNELIEIFRPSKLPATSRPELHYGQTFSTLLEELQSPQMREKFSAKFAIDLEEHPCRLRCGSTVKNRTATSITILR